MSASVHKKLRSFKLSQMDLEQSLWDMANLFRAPRRVYRSINLRKLSTSMDVKTSHLSPCFPV
ncbi:hypothetical protein SOMG_00996 [Schizosaccharomyces osmophilus]|uniref:Uncharacterized protein n=1 Tax=Schizosaccharomyces osmophilus TaxID=2545709 RepID=A0AAE9WBU4_9SCHI|nr:uncharacterized protein SOMG_00996 [Schizosaccharomyces osmophilus]WBW71783.1 hypothetical protein SOMG_00996 [Schizosaccharomyces osmophilus]